MSTVIQNRRRRTPAAVLSTAGEYVAMTIAALIFVAPVYYLIIGSFKPSNEVLNGFAGFLPTNLSFDNYVAVSRAMDDDSTGKLLNFFANSLIVSGIVVLGGLIVNSMAAYSFARLQWVGKDKVFLVIIVLVIVPFESVAFPLLYILNGLRDTLIIQAIPFIANPFSIFLFYTFFLNSPKSIEEAARLDGLGAFGTFVRVVVPNSKPVFATVTILTFLSSWGSFLWPVISTSDPAVRTLPLEIAVFSSYQPINWGVTFAFGTLLVLPVLIVFFLFQRSFVASVAGSAVKG